MSSTTDKTRPKPEELLGGLRAGDGRSYEELVRRYGGRMLGVALRIVRNPEDARDCVQDAFLSAFKNMDGFEGRSSVWTWLHRIVVNFALLKLRSRRRRPECSIEDLMPEFDEYDCRVEPKDRKAVDAETLLAREDVRDAVRDAIERLPDDYRDVLLLRDIEELDTEETAEILKISRGAVKMKLHRARAALKKLIEPVIRGGPR